MRSDAQSLRAIPGPGGSGRRPPAVRPWLAAALLLALVLAVYWPTLGGGMLWDDDAHVTRPELRSWAGLGRIWFAVGATQQYYPVLHTAFWIEHRLWGDATLGYHLANVILHAGACCLLALVLRRLVDSGVGPSASLRAFDSGPVAAGHERRRYAGVEWLAALLFAVHPVCVESVAWISEQKNTLSLVFYLLAALVYLDFDARRRWTSYAGALGLFALALGTKSVTATLPAALLVVLWWRNGRLSWRRDAVPLLPWFAMAVTAGLFTAWVERTIVGAEGARFDLTFGQRLLLAGRVVWFYLGKLAWPADLMFIYPRWEVKTASAGWAGFLVGAVVVTGVLWALRRRARGPLAAWLFFVGSLFPALGFFNVYPFRYSYVADHFQYLASLGLLAAAGAAAASAWRRTEGLARIGLQGLGAIAVAALALVANRQGRDYRDVETLYRATLARNPDSWMAHNNIANLLAKSPAGAETEALAHYEAALRLRPDYAEAHNNLAIELMRRPGREPEAMAQYREALRLRPDYAEAHANLAQILAKLPGRSLAAVAEYEQALALKPDYAEAHNNLATELSKLPGRLPDAVTHYEAALGLLPEAASAGLHYNLANVLARIRGRESEAIAHYEHALRINPAFADAHVNLANLLARQQGREQEAITHFEQALRADPEDVEAHLGLANVLARVPGRMPEAIAHGERALQLKPGYAAAHFNLANLLASLPGRDLDAVAQYERTLQLDPENTAARMNLANVLARLPGREADAISQYEDVLRIAPGNADAHFGLANALAGRRGRGLEAIAQYQEALRIKPDFIEAEINLANVLAALPGRRSEALSHYETALHSDSGLPELHYNLAVLLAEMPGRESDAIAHFEWALRLRPDDVEARDRLAALYARTGRPDDARRQWERVLELDPARLEARQGLGRLLSSPRP